MLVLLILMKVIIIDYNAITYSFFLSENVSILQCNIPQIIIIDDLISTLWNAQHYGKHLDVCNCERMFF